MKLCIISCRNVEIMRRLLYLVSRRMGEDKTIKVSKPSEWVLLRTAVVPRMWFSYFDDAE